MTTGAWIMLAVGLVITVGGLSTCIGIALAHERRRREEPAEEPARTTDSG